MAGPYGAPRDYLDMPAAEPDQYGLFSVATFPDPDQVRFLNGINWEPVEGERSLGRVAGCVDFDYNEQLDFQAGVPFATALPFIAASSYVCKATSRPVEEAEERALAALAVGEQRLVERAISTGELGNEPSFASASDLTPTPGTAVSAAMAVGILEEALSEFSGQVGVLHSPRKFAAFLATEPLAWRKERTGIAESSLGNLWSFGGGYASDAPNGAPSAVDGEAWLFATVRPMIFRSDPFTQPDPDKYVKRDSNDLAILAQRHYLVGWPYGTFAVLANMT